MVESITNSDLMEDIQGPPTSGSIVLPAAIAENRQVHQSTPSLSTKGSETNSIPGSSASAYSRSSCQFTLTAFQNHFQLYKRLENDVCLEDIRKNIRLPTLDLDQEYPALLKALLTFQKYSHPSESSDRYNMMEVKHDILHHVRRFKRLQEYKSSQKEVEYRVAINDLVALAFCHRPNAQHLFECEVSLSLPAEPFTAIADIATFLPMPQEWSADLTVLNGYRTYAAHAFWALTTENDLLTFAVEAKGKFSARDTSSHQLAFYLCSAQHQRRALGYEKHAIYGLSSIGHIATLFVSTWINDIVVISPTRHEFDLSSFSQHMELYVVLCKLAEKSEEQFKEMKANRKDPSILKKNKTAANKPWRELSKPSKVGRKVAGSTRTMSRELSDGITSDSERDSDLFEEDFFRDSFETSKSLLTSENDNYNEPQIPLKAEILQQYIPTDTTALPPAKDITKWAQHIADEVDDRDTIP